MGCMASLDYTGKIDVGCIPIGKCLKLVQKFWGGEFERIWSVYGVENCKIVLLGGISYSVV